MPFRHIRPQANHPIAKSRPLLTFKSFCFFFQKEVLPFALHFFPVEPNPLKGLTSSRKHSGSAETVPWLKQKEVHVRTYAELETALRRAERIVVEGDANLAAYAAALAEPETVAPAHEAGRLRPLGDFEREAHLPRTTRPPRLWPWIAGAGVFTVGAAAAVLLEHFSAASARLGAAPTGAANPTLDPTRLTWPAVAVVVLLVLFFIARQVTGEDTHERAGWRLESPPQSPGRPVIIARIPRRMA